jgi:hypothetical protein
MNRNCIRIAVLAVAVVCLSAAQETRPAAPTTHPGENDSKQYSGMYSFLKEGEFVQVTVEDDGRVSGLISRYSNSDQKTFVDQFFKSGKIDGDKLSFVTQVAQGVSFEFKGSVGRGDGKNPEDEGFYVLKGTLTSNVTDANKKVTSHSQDVEFKSFPKEGES